LNLTHDELDALHLGLSVVAKAGDDAKAIAAASLAEKIDAALPEDRAPPSSGLGFAVYPFADAPRGFVHIAPIRAAIRARRKIDLTYSTGNETSAHVIRPLQTEYWGRIWTLTGWCETCQDFKLFRVDRIQTLDIAFETFEEEPGKRLSDYLDRQAVSLSDGYPAD
jgi:predicted DNA-binding transcriptional regulator YafY